MSTSQPPRDDDQPPQYSPPPAPSAGGDPYGGGQYSAPSAASAPSTPSYGQQGDQYGSQYGGGSGVGAYGSASYGGQAPPRNGLGVTALVLGIVGLLLAWIPFFGLLFGLLSLAAIVLGVIGRRRAKRREATNGGMALAGIVLGIVGVVLAIGATVLGTVVASQFAPVIEECANLPQSQQQECVNENLGG